MGLLTGAISGAAGAVEETTKYALRAMMDEEKAKRILEAQAQKSQQTHQANARFDMDLSNEDKASRALRLRKMLTPAENQPNAQMAADAGLNDSASAGADENIGADVQIRTRKTSMKDMALQAARNGEISAAKDLASADYMASRGESAAARLAQGDRRLDLTEDLYGAKIDNLDARSDLAAARTDAVGDEKPLSKVQQARNLAIDAARKAIEGLDAKALRTKTQKFSATGRENPEYDDQLANRVRMAGKRKVGNDDWFDRQLGTDDAQSAAAPKVDVADLTNRFSADPAMKNMRMGALKPDGREVLDASGKLIGHYR